jgi:tetratricopeptide (TPR) repeat protein
MSFADLPAEAPRGPRGAPDNTQDVSLSDVAPDKTQDISLNDSAVEELNRKARLRANDNSEAPEELWREQRRLRRMRLFGALLLGTGVVALPFVGWRVYDEAAAARASHSPPPPLPNGGELARAPVAVPASAPALPSAAESEPPSAPAPDVEAHAVGPVAPDEQPPAPGSEPAGSAAGAEGASQDEPTAEAKGPAVSDSVVARAGKLVEQAQGLLKRRKYKPARTRYQQALKAYPDYPPALLGLTQIALHQRDKQAVALASQLVNAQPDELGHLVLLGDAYKAAGKRKEAREAWQTAARKGNATARARLKH